MRADDELARAGVLRIDLNPPHPRPPVTHPMEPARIAWWRRVQVRVRGIDDE
jgi:hypothetical protein